MTQKHTPGPYFAAGCCVIKTGKHRKPSIAETFGLSLEEAEVRAVRIAACLNACEDIKNPAAVPELVEALEDLKYQCIEYMKQDHEGAMAGISFDEADAALAAVKAAPGPGGEQE